MLESVPKEAADVRIDYQWGGRCCLSGFLLYSLSNRPQRTCRLRAELTSVVGMLAARIPRAATSLSLAERPAPTVNLSKVPPKTATKNNSVGRTIVTELKETMKPQPGRYHQQPLCAGFAIARGNRLAGLEGKRSRACRDCQLLSSTTARLCRTSMRRPPCWRFPDAHFTQVLQLPARGRGGVGDRTARCRHVVERVSHAVQKPLSFTAIPFHSW